MLLHRAMNQLGLDGLPRNTCWSGTFLRVKATEKRGLFFLRERGTAPQASHPNFFSLHDVRSRKLHRRTCVHGLDPQTSQRPERTASTSAAQRLLCSACQRWPWVWKGYIPSRPIGCLNPQNGCGIKRSETNA